MTADQRQARKYFDGVLMAYQDCAEIAGRVAERLADFPISAESGAALKRDAGIAAGAGAAVAKELADGFRAKLANVKEMITNAPKDRRSAGGLATARKLTPGERSERARIAAKARWKGH